MPSIFEITSDDVALLSEEDLRALRGLLSESEVKARGLSAASVTWGATKTRLMADLTSEPFWRKCARMTHLDPSISDSRSDRSLCCLHVRLFCRFDF
jgi:hypothetical protein